MNVSISDIYGNLYDGLLIECSKEDVINLDGSWKFNWKVIYSKEKLIYKVVKNNLIQGLLSLEWDNDQCIVMKDVEVAPTNFGSHGKYTNIADLLISFACLQSFKLNKGAYKGYLSFTSNGKLIDYYSEKYGAELVFRERMIISPTTGVELIRQNLQINLNPW